MRDWTAVTRRLSSDTSESSFSITSEFSVLTSFCVLLLIHGNASWRSPPVLLISSILSKIINSGISMMDWNLIEKFKNINFKEYLWIVAHIQQYYKSDIFSCMAKYIILGQISAMFMSCKPAFNTSQPCGLSKHVFFQKKKWTQLD